jgi:D-glycero-D-manno-heptose 1,7-bisphosphate phosphatase
LTIITSYPSKKVATIGPSDVKPALCLDLDGTVRYSKNGEFINKPEDVALFDGVEDEIWEYRDKGYLIFGITNQGGVAYGYKTPKDNSAELDAMIALFERGNPFHLIKACFHHESGTIKPYNHRSLLRKPDIGMLVLCEFEAFEAGYIVDWNNSLFVGDRLEDELCAKNAGIEFQWTNDFFERSDG